VSTGPGLSSREVVKRFFVGRALATYKADHQLLPKVLALPVFSSDALSSVAYATEEMMLVLALAGAGALSLKIPLALAVATLLVIVVTSYRQTVRAYPHGGGSYIVAKENLGTIPGLVAAAAILTDYVLTVAVSVTAGTIAVTSAAPELARHKVLIALLFIALVMFANLRGLKESGKIFALPTYGFIVMIGLTLVVGGLRCISGCPIAATASLPLPALTTVTLFLVLKAFASGATALTGVEAIADGVQAFRRPQAKNAAATLAIMAALGITMFLGITVLAQVLHIRVDEQIASSQSVLSQIGRTVYGGGIMFYLLQVFTAGILILAANTSFQDFPRLSSILARDRFMPSQFRNRGDRLVFSNGVVVLALLAGLLVYVYDAQLTHLIQLYVVGVFTAFTLSQLGMVRHWRKGQVQGWRRGAAINGIGAATTGIVLVIVILSKFSKGAWIVIVAIPFIVAFFLGVHRHYARMASLLRGRLDSAGLPHGEATNRFVVLIHDFGPATADAIAHLRALRPESVTPLYVGPPAGFEEIASRWTWAAPRLGELERLPGSENHTAGALRTYLDGLPASQGEFITVVLPEVVSGASAWQLLRQRKNLWLKASLLMHSNVVVMDVPLVRPAEELAPRPERPVERRSHAVLIPVSAVHEATARAVRYAVSLHPGEAEALFFALDPEQIEGMIAEWWDNAMDVPLAIVEAPFRDIGPPLLAEIRKRTSRGDTTVTVVIPELVLGRWWENLLHNQTSLFIKRLLLLEPDVVVASVPVHVKDQRQPSRA
jgi:amino acid transporter